MAPIGPFVLFGFIGKWILNQWKIIIGVGLLVKLRNKFRSLHPPIQCVVRIILALVPTGLLAVMLYAKYISYLDSVAVSQKQVKYFIAILISLFGIIIFFALLFLVNAVIDWQGIGERAIKVCKATGGVVKRGGNGIAKVSTNLFKGTGKATKIVGMGIGKGVKLTVGTSGKGIKVVGKSIKKGTTYTVKGVGKLGGITRKFRRKKRRAVYL